MKKKITLLLLILCYYGSFQKSFSQSEKADSLKSVLRASKEDTNKVNTILSLYLEINYKSPDDAMQYAREGLALSEKLSFKRGIAGASRMVGLSLYYKGEYDSAQIYYNTSLSLNKEIGDTSGIVKALMNIASIEESQGRFESALKFDQDGLNLAEHINNKQLIAKLYNNIGAVHFKINNYDKSLEYFFKSLEIKKQIGDKQAISNTLDNIAEIYRDQKKIYDKALEYNLESLENRKQINDRKGIADSYGNVGLDYMLHYKSDKALEYLLLGFKLQEEVGNKKGVGDLCSVIAKIYLDKNDFDNALIYLNKGVDLGKEMNSRELLVDCYRGLSKAYARQNNFNKAYQYDQLFIDERDSLLNENKNKTLLDMESKYENEKKQKEIQLLNKDKEIQTAEINKQKLIKNATFGGAGIVGIFSLLLIYSFNRRKKTTFEKQISVVEMKALRSQMNPHFIFNSLNSIHSFIQQNKGEQASDYLIKFSRLMRLILENSNFEEVPLQSDLEALGLYIELEAARMNNKFSFSIEVDESIDVENTLIPPLILQPFVENSIWHGMLHKESGGHIRINISKNGDMIKCLVEDNGIGREKATEMKSSSQKAKHKSLGMKITNERIDIINRVKKSKAFVALNDLYDDAKKPLGTLVEVQLPLELGF
ncbi:MAG: tetratricopeptide repeat protein [Bacteroidia bacterium]